MAEIRVSSKFLQASYNRRLDCLFFFQTLNFRSLATKKLCLLEETAKEVFIGVFDGSQSINQSINQSITQ